MLLDADGEIRESWQNAVDEEIGDANAPMAEHHQPKCEVSQITCRPLALCLRKYIC